MNIRSDEKIPRDILYDLISRFIINIPEDEKKNIVRICFQIEIAHWFYLDFYCTEENPHLKQCSMKDFTALILKHIPDMHHHLKNLDAILNEWKDYKRAVPTYGAIVLDKELSHVLLVQSFLARSSWGFPKGKVNEEEPPAKCAVREVFEETGFDISNLINEDEYIEITWNEQATRLYLIPGVDRSTEFCPRTRMEIKAVEWFPLTDLPADRKKNPKEVTPKPKKPLNNPNNFFMVVPFVRKIRKWVNQRQAICQLQKSVSDSDGPGHQHQKDIAGNELHSGSISKHRHLFGSALEDLERIRLESSAASMSPRNRGSSRKDKAAVKRQLFTGEGDRASLCGQRAHQLSSTGEAINAREQADTTHRRVKNSHQFTAESWSNFKFDRSSLFSSIPLPILLKKSCDHRHTTVKNTPLKSCQSDTENRRTGKKSTKTTTKRSESGQSRMFIPSLETLIIYPSEKKF